MISVIVFLPLLGALVVALLPRERGAWPRYVATLFALATFVLSVVLFIIFDRGKTGFQWIDRFTWVDATSVGAAFKLQYQMGVDGLSLPLVVLTTGLTLLSVLISWSIDLRTKEYFAWMLVLETGVLGVFTTLDFLLFFLFWEVELVPMYFLISIWGTGRKEYAALKFVLFTVAGSAFMLAGILLLGFSANTFDIVKLTQMTPITSAIVPLPMIFFFIMAAFAVKLPVFPFHSWLPDAHTNAPTAVSVLLAGVLLKMGGYGMIRMGVSILPSVAKDYALLFAVLAAINIIYGAFLVLRQSDLKRLIAYSSVSHMGYVLLGISALKQVGLTGASLQMFTHGMITGLLFMMVGLVYDRTHTREIPQMSGLMRNMPFVGVMFFIAGFASLGLPALAGFWAELLVFLGTFNKFVPMTVLGVVGVLLSAGYILWMLQRVMWGPPMARWQGLGDATAWWERVPVLGLGLAILVVGIYPSWMVDVIQKGVQPIVARLA